MTVRSLCLALGLKFNLNLFSLRELGGEREGAEGKDRILCSDSSLSFSFECAQCSQVSVLSIGIDFLRSVIDYLFAFIAMPDRRHHMGVQYKFKELQYFQKLSKTISPFWFWCISKVKGFRAFQTG